MNNEFSFGAHESEQDPRTISSESLDKAAMLSPTGKISLDAPSTNDLCNQRHLGVCTACSVRMGAEHHFKDGVRLSEYWHYLIQKSDIDKNLKEGSAIFSSLKSAKASGIPSKAIELKFPLKTDGSYQDFINDFQTRYEGVIPQEVRNDAKAHIIPGYYSVKVDPISIAREIQSDHVLMCRFAVGENTYTPSWFAKDLLPLRAPRHIEGGHAWDISEHNGLDESQKAAGPNSWSRNWCADNTEEEAGFFNFIFSTQKPYFTEAWAISDGNPVDTFKHVFNISILHGQSSAEVSALQRVLKKYQDPNQLVTGFYGDMTARTVMTFQIAHNVAPIDQLNTLQGKSVGPATRAALNAVQNI